MITSYKICNFCALLMCFSRAYILWILINSEDCIIIYLIKIIEIISSFSITHTPKDHYIIYIIIVLNATTTTKTMGSSISYSRIYEYIHVYIHRLIRSCQLTDSVYSVNGCEQTLNNNVLFRILKFVCYTI